MSDQRCGDRRAEIATYQGEALAAHSSLLYPGSSFLLAGSPLGRLRPPACGDRSEITAVVVLAGMTLPILSVDSNGGATLETFAYQGEKSGCSGYKQAKVGVERLARIFHPFRREVD